MATTTEADKKTAADAAAAAAKKTVIPKDMRQRILRGEEAPKETPEQKAKAEADAKAGKEKTDADAKLKADKEAADAKAAEDRKLRKSNLPAIPPVPAAGAPVTAAEVKKMIAEERPAATGAAAVAPAMSPDDKSDMELAEFAAKQHADKYSDLPKRVTEWIGRRDEFLAAKAKELGGRETADFRDFLKGEEFQQFVRQNAPTYQRGDAKKVYEEFIEERGAQRALKKIEPELAEVRRRQQVIEQTPIIQQTVTEGVRIMINDADPKPDEALVEFAKNPLDFVKNNEVEGQIIARHANFFKEAMEETLRITGGLVDASAITEPTPTQAWIDQFITRKEQELETKFPNGAQMPDGKIVVSGSQLQRLRAARPANLAQYRMMLPAEIVGAIAVEGQLEIKRQLQGERQKLERSGFARVKKPDAPPNGAIPPIPAAPASPMAGAAPARGAAGGAPPAGNEPYFKKYLNGTA